MSTLFLVAAFVGVSNCKTFEYVKDDGFGDAVSYTVEIGETETQITIEDTDTTRWHGIAFDGSTSGTGSALMTDSYAVIYDSNGLQERVLGTGTTGTQLTGSTWTIDEVTSGPTAGAFKLVATRANDLSNVDSRYSTFDPSSETLWAGFAYGSGATLAKHAFAEKLTSNAVMTTTSSPDDTTSTSTAGTTSILASISTSTSAAGDTTSTSTTGTTGTGTTDTETTDMGTTDMGTTDMGTTDMGTTGTETTGTTSTGTTSTGTTSTGTTSTGTTSTGTTSTGTTATGTTSSETTGTEGTSTTRSGLPILDDFDSFTDMTLYDTDDVTIEIAIGRNEATEQVLIEMLGPIDKWFAVGFGSKYMTGTYAVTVEGSTDVKERTLGNYGPGTVLTGTGADSFGDNVDGERIIYMIRDYSSDVEGVYDFTEFITCQEPSINIIFAFGTNTNFGYHDINRNYTTLMGGDCDDDIDTTDEPLPTDDSGSIYGVFVALIATFVSYLLLN